MDNYKKIVWKVIDKYFRDNPDFLVKHQLDSYNDFINKGISQILRENNPINWFAIDEDNAASKYDIRMYIGGKEGNKIYYGKPIIYEDNEETNKKESHYLYPNEARICNMTYGFPTL